MDNKNNIHSFDEQLKQAMEQFQPTLPADVWANVSSQIGNVTAASQATLVSKIAAILTKKIILISSLAAVFSAVVVFVITSDKVENTPTNLIGTPIKIETPIVEQLNSSKETETSQNEVPTTEKEGNVILNIEKETSNKKAQIEDKNPKVENTPNTVNNIPIKKSIEVPKGIPTIETLIDKPNQIVQNTIKQTKIPVEKPASKDTDITEKKCNSDIQIVSHKLNDQVYYFEVKSTKEFNNYIWYMGDGLVAFNSKSLQHYYDFEDREFYNISLVVKQTGCKDSIIQRIQMNKTMKVEVHNVFTPNQDGQNEDWNIAIEHPLFYNLKVIDYKGDLVFETNDANEKWNGQHQNVGEYCAVGSYTYLLVYKINSNESTKTLRGSVDLLR